jgi:hypothetical protein
MIFIPSSTGAPPAALLLASDKALNPDVPAAAAAVAFFDSLSYFSFFAYSSCFSIFYYLI